MFSKFLSMFDTDCGLRRMPGWVQSLTLGVVIFLAIPTLIVLFASFFFSNLWLVITTSYRPWDHSTWRL